jgi:hypothetical protein
MAPILTAEGLLKSAYEIARDERIAANKDVLRQLGLLNSKPQTAGNAKTSAAASTAPQQDRKRTKGKEQVEPERKYA